MKFAFVPVAAASRILLLQTGRIDAEIAATTSQKCEIASKNDPTRMGDHRIDIAQKYRN